MKKLILLVDDDLAVLETLNACLQPHYQTRIAMTGTDCLNLARYRPLPDLVLLDVELPDKTGYAVCKALKDDALTAEMPVIFLSSHADVGDVTQGLELGAVDYVTKPVAPAILLARVRTHLQLNEAKEMLEDQNAHLEWMVKKRTYDLENREQELRRDHELAIVALGSIAETRDNETGNHIQRTRGYVEVLAKRLADIPAYSGVSMAEWETFWKSAPLHDIGKVGIPDNILLKPGKLSQEEFEIMKRHTILGRDAIRMAELRAKKENSFLHVALEIAYCHHERWDGKGYPQGLSGEEIPLPARLMAVADVYDALISKRVYKEAMTHQTAVEIMAAERGKQFDPQVLDCFLQNTETFRNIADRYSDLANVADSRAA